MPYVGKRRDLIAEFEVAQICERLHKLPSEVLAEDAYLMRRTWALLGERDRIEAMRAKQRSRKK